MYYKYFKYKCALSNNINKNKDVIDVSYREKEIEK